MVQWALPHSRPWRSRTAVDHRASSSPPAGPHRTHHPTRRPRAQEYRSHFGSCSCVRPNVRAAIRMGGASATQRQCPRELRLPTHERLRSWWVSRAMQAQHWKLAAAYLAWRTLPSVGLEQRPAPDAVFPNSSRFPLPRATSNQRYA